MRMLNYLLFIECVVLRDDEGEGEGASGTGKPGGASSGDSQVPVGSNPFLTPATGSGIQYKKGYIMRKCCTDPNGKKSKMLYKMCFIWVKWYQMNKQQLGRKNYMYVDGT